MTPTMNTFRKLFKTAELCGRCPWCGRLLQARFAKSGPTLLDIKTADRIASIVRENSENKDGLLVENSPGGADLTNAFRKVGFKNIVITYPGPKKKEERLSEISSSNVAQKLPENVEMERGDMLAYTNLRTLESQLEDSISKRLQQKSWVDDPVATVFGSLQSSSSSHNQLPLYLIRKLSLISGLYTMGRIEWFLLVPPSNARTLLSGCGEGQREFYFPNGATLHALYDIKLCTTLSVEDFSPAFRTGPYQKQVQIGDTLLTKDTVPLIKFVPKKDLFNTIESHQIWPFRLFLKQIMRRRHDRLIPLMEKYVSGCGLKMIDMGFTMMDEVWQIKPKQFLDLYLSVISWPEYQSSILQAHVRKETIDITEDHIDTDITGAYIGLDTTEDFVDTDIEEYYSESHMPHEYEREYA